MVAAIEVIILLQTPATASGSDSHACLIKFDLKFLERIAEIKKILVKARIDVAGRSVGNMMKLKAKRVTARVVGQKFHAAAARKREIKSSADLVRAQYASVVGNFFVK